MWGLLYMLHRSQCASFDAVAGKPMRTHALSRQSFDQPQFQIGPIGVRVQQGPKLPPLKRPP